MLRLWYRLAITTVVCIVTLACKKDKGYSRFLTIKCNVKILPDTPIIKMGDTVRITAWIPYNSYDYDRRTWVDVRDMQVNTWGGGALIRLVDTTAITNSIQAMIWPQITNFFTVRFIAGEFENFEKNYYIKHFEKRDTSFYFEMQLVPRTADIYYFRPQSLGRAYLNNGSWRVDISSEIVNSTMNQHLKNEVTPWLSPWQNDYFFKTVP